MIPFTIVRATVISRMPFGVRNQSENGREFTSGYFSTLSLDEEAAEKPTREYALVTILGSGRPYSISVKVTREQRLKNSTRYREVGQDKHLAGELADRIKAALAERREDRNVIDDFRAF
jgi:ferredoxin-NADP reductase